MTSAAAFAVRDWHDRAACQYTDPDLFFIEADDLFDAAAIA